MRNIKIFVITALALALVVLTGACSKKADSNSNGGAGGAGGPGAALSPTQTVKAYHEAGNKKDIAGVKKHLSKGSMNMMEQGAKALGKTVDDAIKDQLAMVAQAGITPTYGKETITGDTATVEVTAQGQTVSMPLIKEDGVWKLAIDKLIQNMGAPVGGGPTMEGPPAGGEPDGPEDEDDHGNH